jgi:hypothetical protein
VFASPLNVQVLRTSAVAGAAIQKIEDALHISVPPCILVPGAGKVTVIVEVAVVELENAFRVVIL